MEEYHFEISPRVLSRIGGLLYLIIIGGGVFGEAFIRSRLIVPGNIMATAANLRTMEPLWRFGIALEIFMLVCAVSLTLVFFVLLRPVNRDLALGMVFFNLVSIALEAANELKLLAALFPLGDVDYLNVLESEQLYAMTGLSLEAYSYGFAVSLIFFAFVCLLLGYLIIKSGYIPRTIGILMQIAGLSYLTNSFALLLVPALAEWLFPAILIPAFVGEASLCLWFLFKGVDVHKWNSARGIRTLQNMVPAVSG